MMTAIARRRRHATTHVPGGHRAAFTLLEVMLALTIGGMTVTTAALLLLGVADRGRAIDVATLEMDHSANAERLLRATSRNLQLSPDTSPTLEGSASSARLRSWCDGAAGWPVPCQVHVSIRDTDGGQTVSLESRAGSHAIGGEGSPDGVVVVELWRRLRRARLLYLLDAAQGGEWTDHWSARMPPMAMAVVTDGDTLILPIRTNE